MFFCPGKKLDMKRLMIMKRRVVSKYYKSIERQKPQGSEGGNGYRQKKTVLFPWTWRKS